ncbi:MAG: DUF192 domain-containing protein [Candidatus Coatesbacteria bacterium]
MALPVAVLTVRRARIRAEIADTHLAKMLGLMFRRRLARNAGLLLCFRWTANHGIHMLNVRFPLDVLFLGADGRIVHIHRAVPGEWGFSAGQPIRYVLEVNAGFCRLHGIRAGDRCALPAALARRNTSFPG